MWMSRRCDAFNTVFEVLTLESSNLSPGCRAPFGPPPGDHPVTPAFLLSRPTLYCPLSLHSDVGTGGVRGWTGSILPHCLLRRSGLDRTVSHHLESADVSESLDLGHIVVVWSWISQLCRVLKASGFFFFFFFMCFLPPLLWAFNPHFLILHTLPLFFISGEFPE